jgi:flagellar hook-associated protein 1
MTSFSALTNAAAALAAQSYGMQVTNQNIANANTDGYTRERVNQAATGAVPGVPTLYATSSNSAGTVATSGVSRLNDPIIDAHTRTEQGLSGYADTAASTMAGVETYFNEPSDTGLTEQLNTFWNDWSAVANNPSDGAARSALLQQAGTVSDTLQSTSSALSDFVSGTQTSLNASVSQINTAATAVGKLNAEISVEQATGHSDPSLLDLRDLLLGQLATLGGAQAQLQADGSTTVTLGGQALVSGNTVAAVGVDASDNVTVAGGAFFTGTTAATISVAITDPSLVAASSTPSAGGNLDAGNARTRHLRAC